MKLISMTDFVIENENMVKQTESEMSKDLFKLAQYAHFLKQPLKLWMFTPCDEDGNILINDNLTEYDREMYFEEEQKFRQAKKRCLFKNCGIFDDWGLQLDDGTILCHIKNLDQYTAELLIDFDIELNDTM